MQKSCMTPPPLTHTFINVSYTNSSPHHHPNHTFVPFAGRPSLGPPDRPKSALLVSAGSQPSPLKKRGQQECPRHRPVGRVQGPAMECAGLCRTESCPVRLISADNRSVHGTGRLATTAMLALAVRAYEAMAARAPAGVAGSGE